MKLEISATLQGPVSTCDKEHANAIHTQYWNLIPAQLQSGHQIIMMIHSLRVSFRRFRSRLRQWCASDDGG